jgi:hypothetical protein
MLLKFTAMLTKERYATATIWESLMGLKNQNLRILLIFGFSVLLAVPAWAERPKMLVMDLKATRVEEDIVSIITDLISTELTTHEEFEIITGADMRQMAELEAERQSIGCMDDSSCLAELAGAMGARLVVYGSVGKLGKNIIISLNLFDSEKAKSAGRENIRATTLDTLPDQIPAAVAKLVSKFSKELQAQKAVKVAKAEPTPEPAASQVTQPEPQKTETPPAAPPEKETAPAATAEVKTGSSALILGGGIAALVVGLGSTGFGTWGLTSAPAILGNADATAQSKEMAVSAYESSPLLIGTGIVALLGGGALLFWPSEEGGDE